MRNQVLRTAAALVLLAGAWMLAVRLQRLAPSRDASDGGDRRIVCMSPAVVELAFAIGAGDRVVGVSAHTMHPPEALSRPLCGGFFDPNYEAILSLRPDLIVTQGRAEDLQRFAGHNGIALLSLDIVGLESILTEARRLGEVLDSRAGAERLCADIQARLDAVRARVAGRPPVSVLLVTAREPGALNGLQAVGPGGFLDDLIGLAGGVNVVADLPQSYGPVSKEMLLARWPAVVVELHGEGGDAEALLREARALWAGLPSLPAVRDGRVYAIEATYAMIPGPRVVELAERLVEFLHGGAGP